LLLFLLVKELLVISHFANRGIGTRGDLNKIKVKLVSNFKGLVKGINSRIVDVLANNANSLCPYLLICCKLGGGFPSRTIATSTFIIWSCDGLALLN
jgi:hypothetical protein